jgi:hypothetical protein
VRGQPASASASLAPLTVPPMVRFEFEKSGQQFIPTHNETLSVAACASAIQIVTSFWQANQKAFANPAPEITSIYLSL